MPIIPSLKEFKERETVSQEKTDGFMIPSLKEFKEREFKIDPIKSKQVDSISKNISESIKKIEESGQTKFTSSSDPITIQPRTRKEKLFLTFKNFFTPTEKVRVRDVLRESGATIRNITKTFTPREEDIIDKDEFEKKGFGLDKFGTLIIRDKKTGELKGVDTLGMGISKNISLRGRKLFSKIIESGSAKAKKQAKKIFGKIIGETNEQNAEILTRKLEEIASKETKLSILRKPISIKTKRIKPIEPALKKILDVVKPVREQVSKMKIPKISEARKISLKKIKPLEVEKTIIKPITKADKVLNMNRFKTDKIANLATDAKSKIRNIGRKSFEGFELKPETKFQLFKTQLVDKMDRLKFTQKKIEEVTGKKLDDATNAYLKSELYIGRAKNKLDKFDNEFLNPFLKKIKDKNISLDDMGRYLYAKHAPERNARIAQINKKFIKGGGSGLSDQDASKILKKFKRQGKIKDLESSAKEFYDSTTNKRLQILKENELVEPELLEKLQSTYKNYVPLKGKKGVELTRPIGKGFSITGKDVKRAFGRKSKAENPFVAAIADYQDSLIKAEKNKVSRAFLKMVEENPNSKLWEVKKQKFIPKFNKIGEVIGIDPQFKLADNVLQVIENGKSKLITIKDPVLAKSMKNLGVEKSINFLNNLNSYLRNINTIFNPEFIITNFQRDLQTSLINVGGEQSKGMAIKVAKNIPKAMKGIWNNIRKGDKTSEWAKTYEELSKRGGKTGFFDLKPVEKKTKELIKKMELYNADKSSLKMKKMLIGLGDYIQDVNEVVEMAVRTSAYKEAISKGISKDKAASLAKNLTVNFNQKGNWGQMLNSFYLFANAGIQGSARVLTALKHKNVRRIAYGIIAGNLALNELNRNINKKEYDKISDQEKNQNMIFMMPNGNYLKIKSPWGYNIFKILGDIASDTIHEEKTLAESFKRLITALDDSYNPLSSSSLSQLISPSVVDPFVQISENKNWFGGPIRPEQPQFGKKKKDSSLFFSSVRPQTKAVIDWVNRITGGTEVEKGFIDVSPENIDHLLDAVTGGTGKFVSNTIASGIDVSKGDMPDLKNIPFARKIIGKPHESANRFKIREILDKASFQELRRIEIEKFKTAMIEELKTGKMEVKEGLKFVNEILKRKARVNAGKAVENMRGKTMEEKKKILSGLNKLEVKEFITILKDIVKTEKRISEKNK